MTELEKTRKSIQRGGRILYRVCRVGKTLLILATILQAALLAAVFFVPQVTEFIGDQLDDSFLYEALTEFTDLESIGVKYQAAIGCFVMLISHVVVFILLSIFAELMKFLAEAEKPFAVENARKLRRRSFWLLLFIIYNPMLGVIFFALMMLFSYVMEYGGYIQERADETNRIQEEMILSFAEITENKSGQTGQHIKRVLEYARILAEELGLEPERVENIRIASTMHDVGKLLIPSEILEKPGKLTDEEYRTIKTHATMGGKLLENVKGEEMQLSRTIALQHHERPDSSGYPQGLDGGSISLEGKIVAVADVYDALTSKRSYKDVWKEEDAYGEILRGRGTQFDPQVVDAFVSAHDRILEVRQKFRD